MEVEVTMPRSLPPNNGEAKTPPQRRRVASNCHLLPPGPIPCPDCPQSFDRKQNLYKHQRAKHGGTKSYPCAQCPRIFLHEDVLTRHVSKSHNKTPRRRRRRTTATPKEFVNVKMPMIGDTGGGGWLLLPRHKFDQDELANSYHDVAKWIKIALRRTADGSTPSTDESTMESVNQAIAALQSVEGDDEKADAERSAPWRELVELLDVARQCADIGSMSACAQLLLDAQAAIGNAFVAGQNDHMRTVTYSEAQELRAQMIGRKSAADDSSSSVDMPTVYRVVADRSKFKYECEECGKRFQISGTLMKHRDVHSGARRYACEQCGMRFRQRVHLSRHRIAIHEESSDPARRPFECERCGKRFVYVRDRDAHVRIRHEGGDVRKEKGWCDKCERIFKQLIQHQITFHRLDAAPSDAARGIFECERCGKRFAFANDRDAHVRIRHEGGDGRNERGWCDDCEHIFANLAQHRRVAHGVASDKTRKPDNDLMTHGGASIRLPSVDYQCHECGKCVASSKTLQRHIDASHGDPALRSQCTECGKRFTRSDNLRYHIRKCHPSTI